MAKAQKYHYDEKEDVIVLDEGKKKDEFDLGSDDLDVNNDDDEMEDDDFDFDDGGD